MIRKCIEEGIISHDWKKSEKYNFQEDNYDHIGVGQFGNLFSVKAHLTFLRYNVGLSYCVRNNLDRGKN